MSNVKDRSPITAVFTKLQFRLLLQLLRPLIDQKIKKNQASPKIGSNHYLTPLIPLKTRSQILARPVFTEKRKAEKKRNHSGPINPGIETRKTKARNKNIEAI